MRHSVDERLFQQTAHSPSYFELSRSMGEQGRQLIDFCIPCNPYFPTKGMFEELAGNLENILKFYPSDAATITAQLARVIGLNPSTIAMSNGSTELITWLDHLWVTESLAIPIPTFGRWTDQPMETGKRVDMFPLQERDAFELDIDRYITFIRSRGSRVAVLCNPNNPDGGFLPQREIIRFLDELADLDLVVIDESFIDFVDAEQNPSVAAEATIRPNVVVLKSLGKNFGLHGIRFGYMVANPALAGMMRKTLPKWNLNSLAEAIVFMLKEHRNEYDESLRMLAHDRFRMGVELARLPELSVFSSQANFLLVKLADGVDGGELRDHLVSQHGVLVRECGNKLGMSSQFLRLVVRPPQDVTPLVEGIRSFMVSRWRTDSRVSALHSIPPSAPELPRPRTPDASGPMPTINGHRSRGRHR
ncbi:histidinol-phosphate/aromatic aminotransferase/cobyric acid decarboxylase-like protein [Pseudonocardia cypriaca]|uniref:Histidinol-phosphate/aromatic aminotransferase/cobyric acid decarboxylase-like protein n=1 Tax=Pseudonocardia cypriaca TaxID=882449 RepID=A0A543GA02_9PSEU|nr:histidinol-phosphate/aromatic aminotransferase/cobyric acid decarboxylase-like protein [Pseudonocardia cypriaca]